MWQNFIWGWHSSCQKAKGWYTFVKRWSQRGRRLNTTSHQKPNCLKPISHENSRWTQCKLMLQFFGCHFEYVRPFQPYKSGNCRGYTNMTARAIGKRKMYLYRFWIGDIMWQTPRQDLAPDLQLIRLDPKYENCQHLDPDQTQSYIESDLDPNSVAFQISLQRLVMR